MAKLGQQVDVYCGRCKVERYHTVAALGPGGRIEQVVCGYCHTARKYKDPTTAKPARATAGAPRARRAAPDLTPTSPPRPYSPAERYEKGDLVDHVKYGIGRVSEVRNDRIDVKFTDGSSRVFLHRGE